MADLADERLLRTIDHASEQQATWWLAAIGVLVILGGGWLAWRIVRLVGDLLTEIREIRAKQVNDLTGIVGRNTAVLERIERLLDASRIS